jgi:chloramphenicol 3-O-phosphotransferase
MINSKEVFLSKFNRTKKRLVKKFPGAKLSSTPSGKFYIGQNGKNIIGEEYLDLAIANTAWEAWRNLDTVEYWNRINDRNKKKLKKSLEHIVVSDDNTHYDPMDYVEKSDGFILSEGEEWTS